MVKAYEILREDDTKRENLQKILSECGNAIDEMRNAGGKFLYRGFKGTYLPGVVYNTEVRGPKDTSVDVQNIVDSVLSLAGFTALRGNSVFCTSNKGLANEYGPLYLIFPKDGFKITWSKKYEDFYLSYALNLKDPNSFLEDPVATEHDIRKDTRLFNELEKLSSIESFFGYHPLLVKIQNYSFSLPTAITKNDKAKASDLLFKIIQTYKEYVRTAPAKKFTISKELAKAMQKIHRWVKVPPPSLNLETAVATANAHGFVKGNLAGALASRNEIYLNGSFYAFGYDSPYHSFFRKNLFGMY
jgi:hypothetical protein